jgi:hypothetical protein
LESVKILPPRGFDPNDPHSYGVLTQAAVALPEFRAPERGRIFCMAVTNENVSGATTSTWSAAIDQAAVGRMIGDGDDEDVDEADRRKRLFVSRRVIRRPSMITRGCVLRTISRLKTRRRHGMR